jgi:hypothetical protein
MPSEDVITLGPEDVITLGPEDRIERPRLVRSVAIEYHE